MFCQKCGTELQNDPAYCLQCGLKVQAKPKPAISITALIIAATAAVLWIGAAIVSSVYSGKPSAPPALALAATANSSPSPSPTQQPKTYNPSFDCSKATAEDLKLICQNADLSALDRQMSQTFYGMVSRIHPEQAKSLRSQQRDWLNNIRKACTDPDCLRNVYRTRLDELKAINFEPQPAVSSPTPEAETVRPVQSTWIVKDALQITPGNYRYYPISFPGRGTIHIRGRFEAMSKDIVVYVVDQDGLINLARKTNAMTYYNSGRVAVGEIDLLLNNDGKKYYLVFNNMYSVFTSKFVKAAVSSSWAE